VIFLVHYSYKFSFSVCISVLHFHLKKVSFYNNFGIVQQHTVPRLTHSYYKAGSQISQPNQSANNVVMSEAGLYVG